MLNTRNKTGQGDVSARFIFFYLPFFLFQVYKVHLWAETKHGKFQPKWRLLRKFWTSDNGVIMEIFFFLSFQSTLTIVFILLKTILKRNFGRHYLKFKPFKVLFVSHLINVKRLFFSSEKIGCDQYRGLPLSAEIVKYWLWPILSCLAVSTKPNSLLKSCTRSVCNCQNIQLYSENWHNLVGFHVSSSSSKWSGPWLLIKTFCYITKSAWNLEMEDFWIFAFRKNAEKYSNLF